MDVLNEIVKESMVGDCAHSSVLEVFKGLTHDQAIEKPIANSHSTYEILYHMIVWQDIFVRNIKDEPADWGEANRVVNEQLSQMAEEMFSKKTWEQLVDDFKRGFDEANDLLETIDLRKPFGTNQP